MKATDFHHGLPSSSAVAFSRCETRGEHFLRVRADGTVEEYVSDVRRELTVLFTTRSLLVVQRTRVRITMRRFTRLIPGIHDGLPILRDAGDPVPALVSRAFADDRPDILALLASAGRDGNR